MGWPFWRFLIICAGASTGIASAEDATVPGELSAPYPTITNISLEWKIGGDDNLNGVASVRYRAAGARRWHEAMPLRRIPAGVNKDVRPQRSWENKHAGSIFDLRPDTGYEIIVSLADTDGGSAQRTMRVRTRPVPRSAPAARIVRVTPETFRSASSTAQPGDVLVLSEGDYGTFIAERDGTPRKPVVVRSAMPGAAKFQQISLRNRRHVQIEGLTVEGTIDILGGEYLAVRRCHIRADYGIVAKQPPGAKNCYIADNVIRGRMPWDSIHMGHLAADGKAANLGEGIEITGPAT